MRNRPISPFFKSAILLWLTLCLCAPLLAQRDDVTTTVSPKLRGFLDHNPKAFQVLTNALRESFTNKAVQLYYFYSTNESLARALHSYPSESDVSIYVRENQQPVDEYICFLYETINARREMRFRQLSEQAESGHISRHDFAIEVNKAEFNAVKMTRDLLAGLKFSKQEEAESYYCKRFRDCPNDFEGFLSYIRKVSPQRNVMADYEMKYDSLRKRAIEQQPAKGTVP
jgi:hypothetical protein